MFYKILLCFFCILSFNKCTNDNKNTNGEDIPSLESLEALKKGFVCASLQDTVAKTACLASDAAENGKMRGDGIAQNITGINPKGDLDKVAKSVIKASKIEKKRQNKKEDSSILESKTSSFNPNSTLSGLAACVAMENEALSKLSAKVKSPMPFDKSKRVCGVTKEEDKEKEIQENLLEDELKSYLDGEAKKVASCDSGFKACAYFAADKVTLLVYDSLVIKMVGDKCKEDISCVFYH